MREISEETFGSIHSFMKGLSDEQIPDFILRLSEKQPNIHSFIYHYLGAPDADPKSLGMGGYLFAIIIRCYEYEYGEFQTITQEIFSEFHNEKKKYLDNELKRNSRNKVISGLRRQAGQRVMIHYLDILMMGGIGVQSVFKDSEKESIKVAIYMIIIFLNAEMEKLFEL